MFLTFCESSHGQEKEGKDGGGRPHGENRNFPEK
jgi:hypothetical protein